MKHYVITRLNCALYNPGKIDKYGPLDKFILNRSTICNRFLARSLRLQTDQDFEWIVLLDSRTPKRHLDMIDSIIQEDFTIMTFNRLAEAELHLPAKKPILMTRVDSDDMLSFNYIHRAKQAAIDLQEATIIDSGVMHTITSDLTRYQYEDLTIEHANHPRFVSSVCSLYRPAGDQRHIYHTFHTKLHEEFDCRIRHAGLIAGRTVHNMHWSGIGKKFVESSKPMDANIRNELEVLFGVAS